MLLPDQFNLRPSRIEDVAQIKALIVQAARELSRGYYNDRQIDAAIAHIFGVDSTLIADGTYFVIESEGELHACGGWSKRRTLFGGDQYAARDASFSDPATDSAKIRAFFVHPQAARCGLGRALLARCEFEAKAAGFKSAELMSTLPGVSFYEACGYAPDAPASFTVGEGVSLGFVPMTKSL